ncbi:heparan sulfate glucosamine 3-O-sulfotransferase 6-like [Diadema antillarum]|uniref:heparan sulfate glucosamine 3-O-sulfotransferase 6-like n=1 Tax=Diadema antillarum TaxID=105358 RepID=UPI003A84A4F0
MYQVVKLGKNQRVVLLLILGLTLLCGVILFTNNTIPLMSWSASSEQVVSKVFSSDQKNPAVVDAIDKGCYLQTADMIQHQHSPQLQAERDCRQRLPSVLIAGGALCGTATMKRVLSFHPDIVVREDSDPVLLKVNSEEDKKEYRMMMPYSLPHQMTIDTSQEYIYGTNFRSILQKNLPENDTKVIVLIRDPVARAMTDFRLLVLDAEAFARNPAETMTLVELFLGLKPFFHRSFFDFDLSSGKLCFNTAEVRSCGEPIFLNRSMPTVPEQLVTDLREFFVPWMKMQHNVANAYFEHRGEHPTVLTPFR